MDVSTLLLYVIAASLVTITPGPTMLLALNNGATGRIRIVVCGIAGAAVSDLILIGAVGCGLGAIMLASEKLFLLVKWIGAAYLIWLAWVLWRAPVSASIVDAIKPATAPGGRAAFMRSLLVALSNPKGLLFFSAFLPQFVQPAGAIAPQYVTLAVVTALIDIALMSVYAVGGFHAMRVLPASALRWLNRTSAGMLAGLAVALSLYRRSE